MHKPQTAQGHAAARSLALSPLTTDLLRPSSDRACPAPCLATHPGQASRPFTPLPHIPAHIIHPPRSRACLKHMPPRPSAHAGAYICTISCTHAASRMQHAATVRRYSPNLSASLPCRARPEPSGRRSRSSRKGTGLAGGHYQSESHVALDGSTTSGTVRHQ